MRPCNRSTRKNKNKSVNKGNSNTGIVYIPSGGNTEPTSTEGHNAEWKNAQKKPKNNIISEITKRINPVRNPIRTTKVWYPELVASSIISLNQKKAQ